MRTESPDTRRLNDGPRDSYSELGFVPFVLLVRLSTVPTIELDLLYSNLIGFEKLHQIHVWDS